MWEVKKNMLQQIIDSNMLKEVRLREVIPVKQRKRHSATVGGNKKGFELAVVGWYSLAKIERQKEARILYQKNTMNWAGKHCKEMLWGHNHTILAMLKEFKVRSISY